MRHERVMNALRHVTPTNEKPGRRLRMRTVQDMTMMGQVSVARNDGPTFEYIRYQEFYTQKVARRNYGDDPMYSGMNNS